MILLLCFLLLSLSPARTLILDRTERLEITNIGHHVHINLVLSMSDEIFISGDERGVQLVEINEAPLAIYHFFRTVNHSHMLYSLTSEGISLQASSLSLSAFAQLRAMIAASSCSGSWDNFATNLPFQSHPRDWEQTITFSSACSDMHHALYKHLSIDWSLFSKPALEDLKWLLLSPHASSTLNATMAQQPSAKSKSQRNILNCELRISAVLLPDRQAAHANVLRVLADLTASAHTSAPTRRIVIFTDLGRTLMFGPEVAASWNDFYALRQQPVSVVQSAVAATRRLAAAHGGLVSVQLRLINPTNRSISLQIVEPLHPFYTILLHTYRVGREAVSDLPSFTHYAALHEGPSNGRQRADSLGSYVWNVELGPQQRIEAVYSAEVQFVHRNMQPPDASRGVEIAEVSVRDTASGARVELSPRRIILPTPIPDQTMPFNVLTLYSTLLAFVLGSFFNTLTRSRSG